MLLRGDVTIRVPRKDLRCFDWLKAGREMGERGSHR